MPLSTRQAAKRKLSQSIGNIEWAIFHLSDIGEEYATLHPEITQPLAQLVVVLEQVKTTIAAIDSKI